MTPRAFALLLALLTFARADTLNLRNGNTVTGTWLGVTPGQIKFQVNDQVQTYPRSDVSGVAFGDSISPPLPPIPAPPPPSDAASGPPGNLQEPEKLGVVYFKDPSGKLIPLEPAQARLRVGLRLACYYEIQGAKSPFRVKSGQAMLFVLGVANGIDPASFGLYPFSADKQTRRTSEFRKANDFNTLKMPLDRTKVGGSYVLKPARDLSTGEYCFSASNSNSSFCFGVDPASPNAVPTEEARIDLPDQDKDERPILTRKFPPSPSDTTPPPLSNDVQESKSIEVGGVSQPAVLQRVDPEYTEKARNAKLSGTVTLAIIVDANGQARDIHVVKALGMGLDESAVESVKKWRFRPGMKDGKPVNVLATVEVNFLMASTQGVGVGLPNPSNDERPARTLAPPPASPPTIELGQTKDQIVSIMGQPQRIANLGAKQIYIYKDFKITLTDGKVTHVQ